VFWLCYLLNFDFFFFLQIDVGFFSLTHYLKCIFVAVWITICTPPPYCFVNLLYTQLRHGVHGHGRWAAWKAARGLEGCMYKGPAAM
jgi:hypothetical protein